MTADKILDALGTIEDEYILDAKADPAQRGGKRTHIRIALYAAAVLAALLCSFVTAMAVNEEFRAAVYTFFHIPNPEIVQPFCEERQQAVRIETVYETAIENAVHIEYLRLDGRFDYGGGVFFLPDETTFYTIKDGQTVELPTHETKITCLWGGTEYAIDFCWCETDGEIRVHSMGKTPANDAAWTVTPLRGRTDSVLLTVSCGRQDEYSEYQLLLSLQTQEVTDILEGCGLNNIISAAFSDDLSQAILTGGADAEVYFYDIARKKLRPVSALAGEPVSAAWFLDERTLCCYGLENDGTCTCRRIDLISEESTVVFFSLPLYSRICGYGVVFTGGRYGLNISTDGNGVVFDFQTGAKSDLEDFTFGADMTVSANPSGTKLLIAVFDREAAGLGISQLGIIDMERECMTILDRRNYTVRYEAAAGWFDGDRVGILAEGENGEKCLYLYSFDNFP